MQIPTIPPCNQVSRQCRRTFSCRQSGRNRRSRHRGRGEGDLVVICRANEGSLHRPPGWFANELNLTKGNSFTGALSIVVIQRRGRDLWTLIFVEDRRIVSTNGRVRQTNCKIPRGSLLPTPPTSPHSFPRLRFARFTRSKTRLFIPFSVDVHSFSYRRLFLPFTSPYTPLSNRVTEFLSRASRWN